MTCLQARQIDARYLMGEPLSITEIAAEWKHIGECSECTTRLLWINETLSSKRRRELYAVYSGSRMKMDFLLAIDPELQYLRQL